MSYQRSAKRKVARKDRRTEDRRLARIERERQARRARARRAALRAGAVLAGCAVLAGAGVGVKAAVAAGRRGPVNMASDGLVLTSDGTVTTAWRSSPLPDGGTPSPTVDLSSSGLTQVVAYLDYADPASAAFWATNGAVLEDWLTSAAGAGTLELHPVALTERSSDEEPVPETTPSPTTGPTTGATHATAGPTTVATDAGLDYSVRAANAFACVAANQPDSALAVHDALFAAQSGDGLTDDELVALVRDAGVTTGGWEKCVRGERYVRWVAQATDRATRSVPFDGVEMSATPLVVVAGQQYTGAPDDEEAFTAFLAQVSEEVSASAAGG